ncbi:MAG: hypothetical protein KJZ62_04870 [Fimbriimonadaceae bacterium]|nr:hypothetical protein [Fimbriimonadaceae bacterium]
MRVLQAQPSSGFCGHRALERWMEEIKSPVKTRNEALAKLASRPLVSVDALSRSLSEVGVAHRVVSPELLNSETVPAILWLDRGHFVVVLSRSARGWIVFDPDDSEHSRSWSEDRLTAERGRLAIVR